MMNKALDISGAETAWHSRVTEVTGRADLRVV